jgi:quercetin dioxygenase-like cupin family protein
MIDHLATRLIARKEFINPQYHDEVAVLSTAEENNGAFMEFEMTVYPGGGTPMHTHSMFEETFTPIDGILGVRLDGEKYLVTAGKSITVPLHKRHHFFNDTLSPVKSIIRFTPGHDGFIKGIAILYGLAADGLCNKKGLPKNILHLAVLMVLMDTKPTGLASLAFPIIKLLAKKARKSGLEKELLLKYYYY